MKRLSNCPGHEQMYLPLFATVERNWVSTETCCLRWAHPRHSRKWREAQRLPPSTRKPRWNDFLHCLECTTGRAWNVCSFPAELKLGDMKYTMKCERQNGWNKNWFEPMDMLGADMGHGNLQADQSGLNRVLAAAQKLQTQACCHLLPLDILLRDSRWTQVTNHNYIRVWGVCRVWVRYCFALFWGECKPTYLQCSVRGERERKNKREREANHAQANETWEALQLFSTVRFDPEISWGFANREACAGELWRAVKSIKSSVWMQLSVCLSWPWQESQGRIQKLEMHNLPGHAWNSNLHIVEALT